MIEIDGSRYDFPCDITRTARIMSSEVSGMLMNLKEYNDALATYYDYNIHIAVGVNQMSRYAEFYEAVTAPEDEHTFKLPYNQGYITFKGMVTTTTDTRLREVNGVTIWKDINVSIRALEPAKRA